jgi:hypothetical protein
VRGKALGVRGTGREVLSFEFWVLSLRIIGAVELGMMNGECGIVGGVTEVSNVGSGTVVHLVCLIV